MLYSVAANRRQLTLNIQHVGGGGVLIIMHGRSRMTIYWGGIIVTRTLDEPKNHVSPVCLHAVFGYV